MKETLSRQARRILVTLNLLGLTGAFALFNAGEYAGWNATLVILETVFVIVTAASFHQAFILTGVWKQVRKSGRDLDERELQLVHEALQDSYRVFTAVSLLLVVVMTLSVRFSFALTFRGHYSLGLSVLIVLNYLVHTLPASVIAFREKTLYEA